MPRVSVLMPVYNGGRFLKEAIESVLAQTFSDFELIILDDASTDDSKSIIKGYSDNRIRYYVNETNSGIVKTLNKGLSVANGMYIARMDADDICMPDRFSKQVAILDERSEIGICGANCILINEHGDVVGRNNCPTTADEWLVELLFRTPVAHPLVMMRKSILIECGAYQEGMEPAEDYDLWVRISKFCKGFNIQEYLLKYRVHATNYSKVKREHYTALLVQLLERNADYLLIDKKYIHYHINFIISNWDAAVTSDIIKRLRRWKNELISRNKASGRYTAGTLKEILNKYYSNALLSIAKSNNNSMTIKLLAIGCLLTASPKHTIRHIMRKLA